MKRVPQHLCTGPIPRDQALEMGVTRDVLEGVQFRRLHQGVYVHRDHPMTWSDHVEAARLALPPSARTTGATRLRQLGLKVGPPFPLHFVVAGDLHLTLDGVFLHRTVKMPPHDEDGVSAEAAFIAFCAEARLIDAIKAGSVLLNKTAMDRRLLERMLAEEPWRRGAAEASYVLPFLEGDCRSLPESELFAYVLFAELPVPAVNQVIELSDGAAVTPDLWFAGHGLAVEYEGEHHQDDRAQYNADIDRYAAYRRSGVPYEQVTKERLRSPKATVRLVHRALVDRGYEGPPPDFDGAWPTLFMALRELVRRARTA
jgi:hypothetical protein